MESIEQIVITGGKYCKSDNLMKYGIRHNKHGDIQKFGCKDCHHFFTISIGFEKMKHNHRVSPQQYSCILAANR